MKEEINQKELKFINLNLNEQIDDQEVLNYINYINSNDALEKPYVTGISFSHNARWIASLYFDGFMRDQIDVKVRRQVLDDEMQFMQFNRVTLRPMVSSKKSEMEFPLFNCIKLHSIEFLNNEEIVRLWDFNYAFKKDYSQYTKLTYLNSINVDYNKVAVKYCGNAKNSLFIGRGKNQVIIE